ncbi:hypothetical protein BC940DRAFT_309971 [Gongronella butleri]|nr:hypothetical protein BC940DRAFT_309971 [Gongronella butleri]
MLNPNALAFTPPGAAAPKKNNTVTVAGTTPTQSSKGNEARRDKKKPKKQQQQQQNEKPAGSPSNQERKARDGDGKHASQPQKQRKASATVAPAAETHKKGAKAKAPAASRRRSSATAAAAQPRLAQQDIDTLPPTSFISLDHNIHPIHQIATAPAPILAHGFERYVAWIERCLQAHETVTLVAMAPVLPDLVTLIGMVQLKGLGYHQEFATFTQEESGRSPVSGIQVKLHRF